MTITIIRGVPGSGKTTFAKKIEALHLENDMFCMQDGSYEFCFDKIPERANLCLQMATMAVENDADVVVSNTFTQLWEMQPYVDLAEEYAADLVVYKMNNNFKSIHNVPDYAIERMYNRWEDFEGEIDVKA